MHPEQFPDYLGLIGDSVDCIKGVPGVGPVKAKELLNQFSSLESIYLNLDKVKTLQLRGAARLTELLGKHRDLAELSKVLATIVCDVKDTEEPFSHVVLENLVPQPVNEAVLCEFFKTYKFGPRDQERLMTLAQRLNT